MKCLLRQREECNHIEDCHQTNSNVPQIPYECIGSKSADEEHCECKYFIDRLWCPVVSKKTGHIGACVEQNSKKCGEAEQEQDNCDKVNAKAPKVMLH